MLNAVVVGIVAAPLTLLLVARQVDLSVGSAVAFSATAWRSSLGSADSLALGVIGRPRRRDARGR